LFTYATAKRLLDLALVIGAAPAIVPLVGVLALLVKRDGGSAFYRQPRLGREERVFHILKLRSMVPDAEACLKRHLDENPAARLEWETTQKLRDDPRVTPFGRFLRKYSLDELPQLWNVVTGDMSLVGPRPMFPQQRKLYPGSVCFAFRPGLTGLWQVSERNQCSFAKRAEYDARYAETISLATDLAIIWRTVAVVAHGTGM
jgi:lipopolysaccharide/colanic/teichoic acid biosynthesis glycosyltransferase